MRVRSSAPTACLIALLGIGFSPVCVRAQSKPLVVVTFAPAEQLVQKVEHIAQVANLPQFSQRTLAWMQANAQGLDPRRSVVGVLQADEQTFQAIGFIPVVDPSLWLRSLPWAATMQELDNGTWQGAIGRRQVFVKAAGEWAVISDSVDGLVRAPDPAQFTAAAAANQDLDLQIYLNNIPAGPRDAILQQLSGMLQFSMQQQASSKSAAQQKLNAASLQRIVRNIQQLATEGETISAGLRVDPENEAILIHSSFVPVSGTALHKKYLTWGKTRTRLSEFFVPKATLAVASAYRRSPDEVSEQIARMDLTEEALLEQIMGDGSKWTPEAKQALQVLVEKLVKLAKATIESGQTDAAASAMVLQGGLAVIAGIQTVNAGELASSVVQRAADLARQMNTPVNVKLDFHRQGGLRFHAAQVSLPKEVDLSAVFGDKLTIYVATSADFVFLGLGDKSLPALRKAALAAVEPQSAKSSLPLRFVLSIGQIVTLAADVTQDERVRAAALRLESFADQDQLLISQTVGRNGALQTKVEIQEGIVAGLAAAVEDSHQPQ